MTGFDALSPIYDSLSKIVFWGAIQRAQKDFLFAIEPYSRVLILGGGTGWLLRKIMQQEKELKVTYVELSDGMMERTKRNCAEYKDHIEYVSVDARDCEPNDHYDVIITNFFLDMFDPENIEQLIAKYTRAANKHCIWLLSDFVSTRQPLSRMLIFIMYTFFRWTCGIKSKKLYDYDAMLQQGGWRCNDEKRHYFGMIRSAIYQLKQNS